MECDFQQRGCT